jgi:diguanylate cyclase (GGDEF)-like protein
LSISTDITGVVALKEQAVSKANTDALTGILSRRFLLECGEYEVKPAKRNTLGLAVVWFDIDKFKSINDQYGHEAGDLVLQACVQACKPQLREIDRFGRMGGDEFVVVLPGANFVEAFQVSERMREAVSNTRVTLADGSSIACTISMGMAVSKQDEPFKDLLSRADAALYLAKSLGRNRVGHLA